MFPPLTGDRRPPQETGCAAVLSDITQSGEISTGSNEANQSSPTQINLPFGMTLKDPRKCGWSVGNPSGTHRAWLTDAFSRQPYEGSDPPC